MLSPVPSLALGSTLFQSTQPRRYSLRNFQLCPDLQKELNNVAIRHIASNLLKSLLAVKPSEFIDARNRVDVPYGLFGLSLDNFYVRRKENIVYIDVLKMVCRETLEQAKICIVLDDLQDYTSRLFNGYRQKNLTPILNEITKSINLLTINDTIVAEFRKNSETQQKLLDKLNVFNLRERNAISYMDNQVYDVQNNCVESELVLDPIEFRYKLNFHNRTTDQSEQKLRQAEDELKKNLENVNWTRNREDTVSECICMKQKIDIDMLKTKLESMLRQYDRDYENVDGQISYKINAMDIMREQRKDCIAKMEVFAVEKLKLIEWHKEWKIKQEEARKAKKAVKKAAPKKAKTPAKDEKDEDEDEDD